MKIIDVGIGIVLRHNPNRILTKDPTCQTNLQLLITRRPADTVFGGYWELPGGKTDPDEGVDDCVRRELSEEVGVCAEVIGALSEVIHTYPHGTVRLHPRLCRLAPGSPPPANLHVEEHRWCSLADLEEYQFPPANDSIVAELKKTLQSGTEVSDAVSDNR